MSHRTIFPFIHPSTFSPFRWRKTETNLLRFFERQYYMGVARAILCVDDERIVLISLRDRISKHFGDRYRYEVAESADEAWEVIEELCEEGIRLLIIVSDWLMPGMRGDEFLIQVHERFPDIVAVLLTDHADEAAIERACQAANLHAYIAKPWTEETLIGIIQSGLEKFDG